MMQHNQMISFWDVEIHQDLARSLSTRDLQAIKHGWLRSVIYIVGHMVAKLLTMSISIIAHHKRTNQMKMHTITLLFTAQVF